MSFKIGYVLIAIKEFDWTKKQIVIGITIPTNDKVVDVTVSTSIPDTGDFRVDVSADYGVLF